MKNNIIIIFQKFVIINFVCLISILLILIYLKARLFIPASPDLYIKYLIASFIPVLIVNIILITILIRYTKFALFFKGMKKNSGGKYFFPILISLFTITISYFPNPDISLIHLLVGIAFLASCWSLVSNNINHLLIFWLPINFLFLLIIVNMSTPQGLWGRVTHLYKFRTEEPVLGEGGRLVPNLDIYLKGYEDPKPKKFVTNKQGFRNSYNIDKTKDGKKLRILNLGDSFSIGYHLDQKSFLGPLLENKFKTEFSKNIEVLNAEISDPAYGLYYIQNHGLNYNPDIMILGLCANGFTQAYSFASDGQRFIIDKNQIKLNSNYKGFQNPILKYKNYIYSDTTKKDIQLKNQKRKILNLIPYQPLLSLIELSTIRHIKNIIGIKDPDTPRTYEIRNNYSKIKLIDGFPNIGFYLKDHIKPIEKIYKINFEILNVIKNVSNKAGAKLILLYFPTPFEIINEEWLELCSKWNLNQSNFELSKHRKRISQFSDLNNILFVDPTLSLINSNKKEKLFLPKDAHLSELGHKVVSDYLFSLLIEPN